MNNKENPFVYKSLTMNYVYGLPYFTSTTLPMIGKYPSYFEYIKGMYSLFPKDLSINPSWLSYINAIRQLDRCLMNGDFEGAREIIRRMMNGLRGLIKTDIVSWHLFNLLNELEKHLPVTKGIKRIKVRREKKRRLKPRLKPKKRKRKKEKIKTRKRTRERIESFLTRIQKKMREIPKRKYTEKDDWELRDLFRRSRRYIDRERLLGRLSSRDARYYLEKLEAMERGELEYIL